jgi:hypothetical protein
MKAAFLNSVILSEGERKTLFSRDGQSSRSRRTSPLFPKAVRSGTNSIRTWNSRRNSLRKAFPFHHTLSLCHLGPSTAARQNPAPKQIFLSPSLRMTDFEERDLRGVSAAKLRGQVRSQVQLGNEEQRR